MNSKYLKIENRGELKGKRHKNIQGLVALHRTHDMLLASRLPYQLLATFYKELTVRKQVSKNNNIRANSENSCFFLLQTTNKPKHFDC